MVMPASNEDEEKLHGSYQQLYRQLNDKFAKFGLETFHGVLGEKYDWMSHEQVSTVEATETAIAGTVIEEVAAGLRCKAGVIRKVKVVVAVAPEPPPEEAEAADGEEVVEEAAPEAEDTASEA